MAWINLFIAGIFEIMWAVCLKLSHGFSVFIPSLFTVIGMVASYYFLALATKYLPIGTSYTIWTGMGAVGTVILGVLLLGEQISPLKICFLSLIIVGIIGLKVVS